jgi:hypothetical protein
MHRKRVLFPGMMTVSQDCHSYEMYTVEILYHEVDSKVSFSDILPSATSILFPFLKKATNKCSASINSVE